MRKLAYTSGSGLQVPARVQIAAPMVATGASVPAPIEGWDAVSPIAAMSPKRATQLDNFFPQPDFVELRRGFIRHADTATSLPVETLMAYEGVTAIRLFAASVDSIFDVTGSTATTDVTGLTNTRFQYINFATTGGLFLYAVNGADDPQYYDGTTWSVATITGLASAAIDVNAHKNRIWFVAQDSSDAYYLPVDSIQGAATKFPLGGLFTEGGHLRSMGTWSIDAGDGPDDYAVFLSSRGQVAIYRGVDPAVDFVQVGVFDMGAPIGQRCLTRVGADIAIISIDGVVPLSRAMIFERAAVQKVALTERIQRVMNQSARDWGNNFGWQLISYPKGTRAILNVPVVENETQYQYVMNTLSGAWCRFLGMNGSCWELLNDTLYFGGNDGVVYEADTSGTDHGAVLHGDLRTAFNYFGQRGRQKRWTMCRPQLTTDGQVNPGLALNVDFRTDAPISIPTTIASVAALWDEALWDVDVWPTETSVQANWTTVAGLGYCASIRMAVDVSGPGTGLAGIWGVSLWGSGFWGEVITPDIALQVNAFDITYEVGAIV